MNTNPPAEALDSNADFSPCRGFVYTDANGWVSVLDRDDRGFFCDCCGNIVGESEMGADSCFDCSQEN